EFPFVFRTRRGGVGPTTEVELGALAVTLGAVALLASEPSDHREPAESVLDIDGHEFRAIAYPPDSSSQLDQTPPSDTSGGQSRLQGPTARTGGPRPRDGPQGEARTCASPAPPRGGEPGRGEEKPASAAAKRAGSPRGRPRTPASKRSSPAHALRPRGRARGHLPGD